MSEYLNRVPLSVTLERINKLPLNNEENRVDAPGPNGDINRPPTGSKKK